MNTLDRRQFVVGGSALFVAGALAGCLGNGEEPEDTDANDDDNGEDNEIEEHMEEANGYDGTIDDRTGEDEIAIEVGDPEGGSNYMFQPAAAEIDEGTTVVWEWVDDDSHSVTHTNGDEFDSGIESNHTFEHTFEQAGTYLYHCQPHRSIGHLGALEVV